jgi:alpha-ribazole phosphatase
MDLAVDPEGLAAAVASLRSRIPAHVLHQAMIFTSPASRCLDLARELAAPREPIIVEELREMDFGAWEGLPWESVPRIELDAWAADAWTYRAGGGESAAMVAARWRRWAARVTVQTAEHSLPVIAVTHAGVIRVALAGASRLGPELEVSVPFGSVHRAGLPSVDTSAADINASAACTP